MPKIECKIVLLEMGYNLKKVRKILLKAPKMVSIEEVLNNIDNLSDSSEDDEELGH